jgi:signal transduction histidine kinase
MDLTPSSAKAPRALTSLLQVVDEPAALLARSGRVLGANEDLLGLARALGVSLVEEVGDIVPDLSTEDLPESAHVVVGRSVTLRGGEERGARLMRLEGLGVEPFVLLLLDQGAEDAASASGRRSSRLRHDLAGPLTAILGTAELLLMREEGLDGETRESLEEILGQCSRISELIARDRAAGAQEGDESQ